MESALKRALPLNQESVAAALKANESQNWADDFNGVQITCQDVSGRSFVISIMVVPFETDSSMQVK